MKTCQYAGTPLAEPRSHPWIDVPGSPECRYHDFKVAPEQIRTSLEDFLPWSQTAAIEDFYALLTWLNHPKSVLESSDCAFSGPHANENAAFGKTLECSGRVMVLFRQLQRNTVAGQLEALALQLHVSLAALDPNWPWGVIGTTLVPIRYRALVGDGEQQLGQQLMISFWSWGNSERELLRNLRRVFKNLSSALRSLSLHRPPLGQGAC